MPWIAVCAAVIAAAAQAKAANSQMDEHRRQFMYSHPRACGYCAKTHSKQYCPSCGAPRNEVK